jgi:hypothetical protein
MCCSGHASVPPEPLANARRAPDSVTAPRKSWFITPSAWIPCGDMARFVTNRCHTPRAVPNLEMLLNFNLLMDSQPVRGIAARLISVAERGDLSYVASRNLLKKVSLFG